MTPNDIGWMCWLAFLLAVNGWFFWATPERIRWLNLFSAGLSALSLFVVVAAVFHLPYP